MSLLSNVQLIKIYGMPETADASPTAPAVEPERMHRHRDRVVQGDPNQDHISTSYVERQNLTMRMSMRRFTRLTNGFSRKVEDLAAAVALHFL